MIGFIKGILCEQESSAVTVDVNGIGYEVQIPQNILNKLPAVGTEVRFFTHFVVREDGQSLYGFISKEQRSLFRSLIKISSVGPKLALAILSSVEPEVFISYVADNNTAALEHIPGVGGKTARRLIVELRDKLSEWKDLDVLTNSKTASVLNDAVSALMALGYKSHEAQKVVSKYKDKNLASEDIVRLALKDIK